MGQHDEFIFIMRRTDSNGLGLEEENKEALVENLTLNVVFKARKVRDSILEGQDRFIMSELDDAERG